MQGARRVCVWGRFVMDTDCRLCWCVSCLLQCCTTQTVWGVIIAFATPSSDSKVYFWILFAFCIWAKHLNARVGVCLGVMIWIHFTPNVSCLALNTSARTLVQMCLNFALNCKHKHTHKEREKERDIHAHMHMYVCFGAHCHTHEARNAVAQHWHLIWIRCCYCSFVCVQSAFSPPPSPAVPIPFSVFESFTPHFVYLFSALRVDSLKILLSLHFPPSLFLF